MCPEIQSHGSGQYGIYAGGEIYFISPETGTEYKLSGFDELGAMPKHLRYYHQGQGTSFTEEEAKAHLAEMIQYISDNQRLFFPPRQFP